MKLSGRAVEGVLPAKDNLVDNLPAKNKKQRIQGDGAMNISFGQEAGNSPYWLLCPLFGGFN